MKRFAVLAAALCLTASCTFSAVRPTLMTQRPPTPPRTLVIGAVQMADERAEGYRLQYTRGVADWIKRNGGLDLSDGNPVLAESVILITRITLFEKGSAAKRALIGMGAGQAKIRGEIELRSPDGAILATFTSRESYLGGWGIGGIGFLDMEDLTRRFAETVAETAVKWARGEKIE